MGWSEVPVQRIDRMRLIRSSLPLATPYAVVGS